MGWILGLGCVGIMLMMCGIWAFWTFVTYGVWNWVAAPMLGWSEISLFQAWLVAMALTVLTGMLRAHVTARLSR